MTKGERSNPAAVDQGVTSRRSGPMAGWTASMAWRLLVERTLWRRRATALVAIAVACLIWLAYGASVPGSAPLRSEAGPGSSPADAPAVMAGAMSDASAPSTPGAGGDTASSGSARLVRSSAVGDAVRSGPTRWLAANGSPPVALDPEPDAGREAAHPTPEALRRPDPAPDLRPDDGDPEPRPAPTVVPAGGIEPTPGNTGPGPSGDPAVPPAPSSGPDDTGTRDPSTPDAVDRTVPLVPSPEPPVQPPAAPPGSGPVAPAPPVEAPTPPPPTSPKPPTMPEPPADPDPQGDQEHGDDDDPDDDDDDDGGDD